MLLTAIYCNYKFTLQQSESRPTYITDCSLLEAWPTTTKHRLKKKCTVISCFSESAVFYRNPV